ncbi:Hpt domain-containing protein [Colwellia sp. MEBiC06753]
MTDNHLIDTTLLQGYLENLGADVVMQMLELYQQQSIIYLNDIDDALDQGSQQLWHERCHKMKGAAGSVGLLSVHKHLVAIERSEESGQQKSEHLARLRLLNDQAIDSFRQWLGQS